MDMTGIMNNFQVKVMVRQVVEAIQKIKYVNFLHVKKQGKNCKHIENTGNFT